MEQNNITLPEETTKLFLPQDTATVRAVRDMFLVDFYEKFKQTTEFIAIEDIQVWADNCKGKRVQGISYISTGGDKLDLRKLNTFCGDINSLFVDHHLIISQILQIGNGKISICGSSLLYQTTHNFVMSPKFYFDSLTVLEATDLLLECIKLLGDDTIYMVEHNVLYYKYKREHLGRFHLTVYENKQSLLRNIGPSPDRHGWNPINGYFGTLSGGMSLAMGIYSFDIDHEDKPLYNYTGVGLKILFHGLNKYLEWGDSINFREGYIECGGEGGIRIQFHNKIYEEIYLTYSELMSSPPSIVSFTDKYTKAIKPNNWYLDDYTPYIVGISDDRYVALSNIRKKFNLDIYVFRILCNAWLTEEYLDARKRLVSQNY